MNRLARFCDDLKSDLTYAIRQLAKSPGFAVLAVLTIALGIGANTAIFSLLNALMLRELPIHAPQELVLFGDGLPEGSTRSLTNGRAFSYPMYREFQRRNHVFSDVAAINSTLVETHGRVASSTDREKINVELVSGTYFTTLGVNPVLGRMLTDADDVSPGGHPLAVASYSWWQRHFAKDPAALATMAGKVTIGSTVYSVVGVAPPGFFGITVGRLPDLWIPLAMEKEISPAKNGLDDKTYMSLHIVARRKSGIGEKQAAADTNLLFQQILHEYSGPQLSKEDLEDIQQARIELTPAATGRSRLRSDFSSPLNILMGVVALVLLIACANVANLLLARATARQREIAVRMSMGAKRSRLIRQLLVESGLLGLAGSIFGVLLAWGASGLLLLMVSPASEPLRIRVTPDLSVLVFTLTVAIATTVLFGTVPAFYATRLELAASLKEGRGVISNRKRNRLSRGLVIGQVALSLVLLVGAGLFLRSLSNLMDVNTGFEKQNVLLMEADPAGAGYQPDARLGSVMERIEARVQSIPGIQAASFAYYVFNQGSWSTDNVTTPGWSASRVPPQVIHNIVGSQYFDTMKMPIVLGRALEPGDNATSRKVAVINETMARTYFPGVSPLRRTFSIGRDRPDNAEWQNIEVVGVVRDAKYLDLEEAQKPATFHSHLQHRSSFLNRLVVRYTGNPAILASEIRQAAAEIDPNLPIGDATTLTQLVDDAALNKRMIAQLSAFFGLLAAFLAGIGIYGVMSYGITRRTNEFGVRMALGAVRHQILWVVLQETLRMVVAGVLLGLALTLASARFVESLLFGIQSFDPLSVIFSMILVIAVALLAAYFPARRATRIDPLAAIRYE